MRKTKPVKLFDPYDPEVSKQAPYMTYTKLTLK